MMLIIAGTCCSIHIAGVFLLGRWHGQITRYLRYLINSVIAAAAAAAVVVAVVVVAAYLPYNISFIIVFIFYFSNSAVQEPEEGEPDFLVIELDLPDLVCSKTLMIN